MKESLLYEKLEKNNVRCKTCAHRCFILPGKRGICGVRENQDGKLYSLVYGKVIARHLDPIEKKPFFHFLPGTTAYSIATVGCNLACKNCQNWDISQGPKLTGEILGEEIRPEEIVEDALNSGSPTIAYTYTEPTIFLEYALDIMKLAKKKGLKNIWVTNGYMSEETLNSIAPYLDAANVDLKGFSEEFYSSNCGARLEPVLETLKRMKKKKIWVEITTLVIPTLSDDPEMFKKIAEFIVKELGPETPWHISRFSPEISWKLQDLPETPLKSIENACNIGLKTGLKYVYSGNVPGIASEDTYCPKCNEKMIARFGYFIQRFDKEGKCSKCETGLNLILK